MQSKLEASKGHRGSPTVSEDGSTLSELSTTSADAKVNRNHDAEAEALPRAGCGHALSHLLHVLVLLASLGRRRSSSSTRDRPDAARTDLFFEKAQKPQSSVEAYSVLVE